MTTPTDARLDEPTPATSNRHGVAAAWGFTTRMEWPAYVEWVTLRLAGFRLKKARTDGVVFVRSGDGDNFAVIIERVTSTPALHVRVTWRGSAS
jgi:hypothetical protein